jgi:hypothetical protein
MGTQPCPVPPTQRPCAAPPTLPPPPKVLDILLSRLRPAAALSLPALLDMVAQVARDLQGDFVPLLPRVTTRWAQGPTVGSGGGAWQVQAAEAARKGALMQGGGAATAHANPLRPKEPPSQP